MGIQWILADGLRYLFAAQWRRGRSWEFFVLPLHEDTTHCVVRCVGTQYELSVGIVKFGGCENGGIIQMINRSLPGLVNVILFVFVEEFGGEFATMCPVSATRPSLVLAQREGILSGSFGAGKRLLRGMYQPPWG